MIEVYPRALRPFSRLSRRHPPVRLPERDPLLQHHPVRRLRREELRLQLDLLGVEPHPRERRGHHGEGFTGEVDAAEERGFEELTVAVEPEGSLTVMPRTSTRQAAAVAVRRAPARTRPGSASAT